jgi:hypothetical protein
MRLVAIIASLEIATAVGIAVFWLLFFTVGVAPTRPPPGYFAFEYSFVLSDIVLSLALLIAGALLLQERPFGRVLSLACAGSLVFLGLVDLSFNNERHVHHRPCRRRIVRRNQSLVFGLRRPCCHKHLAAARVR